MSTCFYRIFLFNTRHKGLFYGGLTILLLFLAFQVAHISLDENISDIFPKDETVSEIEVVFNSASLNSNLILHLYATDSSLLLADSIIAVSHVVDSALAAHFASQIDQRLLYYPDTLVSLFFDFFSDNLPLYLTDDDYKEISKGLNEDGVEAMVSKNFKALMSPMGIFGSKMILRDPFGYVQMPLNNFRHSQFDPNFSLYKNHLFTVDKQHLLYFLQLNTKANETAKNSALINELDRLIEQYETPNIKIEYFGAPAVAVANATRIKKDITLSVSLAIAIILLLIVLYFKNWRFVFLVLLPGIFGALVGLAIMTMMGMQISLISLGVGSIMVGITVDFSLHLFNHYRDDKSMKLVYASIVQPMLMSSLTTALAFFALTFINSDALTDLGFFVGFSVLSASLFALMVLPHFLPLHMDGGNDNFVEISLNKLGKVPLYKKRWALLSFTIITVVSLFYYNKINFNSDMMTLNYMPDYLQENENRLSEISNLSGRKIYLLTSGDDFWDALQHGTEVNKQLDILKAEGLIYGANTLNALVPDQETQKKRLDKWQTFWQNTDTLKLQKAIEEKAAEYGFKPNAYKGLKTYLDKKYSTLNDSELKTLLSVAGNKYVIESPDKTSLITIVNYDHANKAEVLKRLENLPNVRMLDVGHIANKLVELLSGDFNKLISISVLVVFGILLIIYGRIELALITISPIAIGWLWTLGLMGIFNLTFNIVNIIICSMIFGLGIDYSIFNMRGLTQKYALGKDHRKSFRVSIWLSALTTIIGIGVLLLAQHPALKSIALVAVVGISSVFFLTLFVEEALYQLFIQGRKERGLIPFTFSSFILSVIAFVIFVSGCFLLMGIRLLFIVPIFPKKQKLLYHYLIMLYCRFMLYVMMNTRKKIVDRHLIDYSKPSVIISNHHSFLDILMMLMFHPKVIMVTNDWVYNSPFFGIVVQYADFIQASAGLENQIDKIKKLVEDGYSIIVFPEGQRSETIELSRFHKGAFYLAEILNLDIQPVVLHGTHQGMPKKDGFYLRNSCFYARFLERISIADAGFGNGYKERTKQISRYFKSEYSKTRATMEIPAYHRETLYKNYLFKGPVLEWYFRIKLKLENNYIQFNQILPDRGRIIDIGCGYGFLSYSLALNKEGAEVTGLDYDAHKIEIAKNCPVRPPNLQFYQADAMTFEYPMSVAFILSDVLHYLMPEEQRSLIEKLIDKLEPGGVLLVRDGDKNKTKKHRGTKLTELFSTNSGFNKTRNKLNFISIDWLRGIANEQGMDLQTIENAKLTSNTISILKKKNHG